MTDLNDSKAGFSRRGAEAQRKSRDLTTDFTDKDKIIVIYLTAPQSH